MKKIIEITLNSEDDLFDKYNRNLASRELINYLIDKTPFFNRSDTLKIVVNNNLNIKDEDPLSVIKESLRNEYEILKNDYNKNTIIQVLYLISGITVLFISTLITDKVLSEIILIIGWLFIWSMMEMEMFNDKDIRKRTRVIKKLLASEIIEK